MATYVETCDVKVVIDPGSALGPRFNLNPHEREYRALSRSRETILEVAKEADVLTVSHFHYDHYLPSFENWMWIWSSPELAERLYRGKLVLMKDPSSHINLAQRKRGYLFKKFCSRVAKEVHIADGKTFRFGETVLEFSSPVYHGPEGSKLGFVLILTVRTEGCCLVHAPDVQGPMYEEPLRIILKQSPDAVIIGGPPIYLEGFKIKVEELERGRKNLMELARRVPLLIVDHHLLRSSEYREYLSPVISSARNESNRVLTAAEFIGKEPELLEAKRRELHAREPVKKTWYKRLEKGILETSQD